MTYCEMCNALPCNTDNPNKAYHDHEYGAPVSDDNVLFERLVLEINQAGLSWTTILKKRAAFQAAYSHTAGTCKAFQGFGRNTVFHARSHGNAFFDDMLVCLNGFYVLHRHC